jgi:hypothetical protein
MPYNIIESTKEDMNFLNVPIFIPPSSTLHYCHHAPKAFFPDTTLSSVSSLSTPGFHPAYVHPRYLYISAHQW